MKRHWSLGAFSGLLAALSFGVTVASAHVTVWPKTSPPGAFETYTVRVPSERPAATIRIELDIPDAVTFSKVAPKTGWRYELVRSAAGKVTGVTWSGGSLGPDEFDQFVFQARNPKDPGKVAWKARQFYADGTTVEWTGPEGSNTPASITELKAGSGGDASHSEGAAAPAAGAAATAATGPAVLTEASMAPSGPDPLALGLGGAGFVVGSLALVLSVVALRRAA